MTDLNIYTVSVGFGLYVVRAVDEDDARRVALAGPALGEFVDPAREYGHKSDRRPQAHDPGCRSYGQRQADRT